MEFRILGPLEVHGEDGPIPLGRAKSRAVLAVLLLHANEPVSAERLALALWAERARAGAVKTVQVHVSRLRKSLGQGDLIETTAAGYRMRVHPGELDLERFERLLEDGGHALAAGQPEHAALLLRKALGLWRGPALADLSFEPFAHAEIVRLEEQRLAALELRVQAELAAGRHPSLVGELRQLVAEHPTREPFARQLMLALYRSGRQTEALEVFQRARSSFVAEFGIEPGSELRELNQAMLTHDPRLDALLPATPVDRTAGDRSPPANPQGGVPAPPNRTIGREAELRAIGAILRAEEGVRLLTVTGPGGVGKTRLALEAARSVQADYADGARFVSLAALTRSEDIPAALATACGVVLAAGETAERAVRRFLGAKRLLLVADNIEQLLPGAALFVAGLLESCPGLTMLATSREPLGLHVERRFPVAPLALPGPEAATAPVEDLAGIAAVALFCERARSRDNEFDLNAACGPAVAEICRRVDGLPLAIELAAARSGTLSPTEIAERLDAALGTPDPGARDAPPRHRTLRATIDWSHQLLSDAETTCFARLAVFAGGATLQAAESVTAADFEVLDLLVAKGLLVRRRTTEARTRLVMLETIRAYATERLTATGDEQAIRERHCSYFLAFVAHHGADRALWGARAREHLARLDGDGDNLHAALGWAVSQDRAELALTMCAALGSYWLIRGRYSDAAAWVDRALQLPRADAHPALRVDVLCIKAWAMAHLGRRAEQATVIKQAEALARALANPRTISRTLQTRAAQATSAGHVDVARPLAEEALVWAREAGDNPAIAMAAFSLAITATDATELRDRVQSTASLLEALGDLYHLANLFASASYAALGAGSDHDAEEFIDRAIPIAQELDDVHTWMLLQGNIALTRLLTGEIDAAREAFAQELRLCRELGARPGASEGLLGLAAVAAIGDDRERAARLVGAAREHAYGSDQSKIQARLTAAFLDPARRRHTTDLWDAAMCDGAALSIENAITYALDGPVA